jgi:hypothetical protein
MTRLVRCAFDNVCSCIRRTAWTEHPFRAAPIAEDLQWAHDVLLAGYSLAFVPDAVVLHSHDRSPIYEFKRTPGRCTTGLATRSSSLPASRIPAVPTTPPAAKGAAASR